jgi:hypothetical protein
MQRAQPLAQLLHRLSQSRPPLLRLPTRAQRRQRSQLNRRLSRLQPALLLALHCRLRRRKLPRPERQAVRRWLSCAVSLRTGQMPRLLHLWLRARLRSRLPRALPPPMRLSRPPQRRRAVRRRRPTQWMQLPAPLPLSPRRPARLARRSRQRPQ